MASNPTKLCPIVNLSRKHSVTSAAAFLGCSQTQPCPLRYVLQGTTIVLSPSDSEKQMRSLNMGGSNVVSTSNATSSPSSLSLPSSSSSSRTMCMGRVSEGQTH